MFQHILVPVDFSEKNKQALDIAFGMAAYNNGRVSLLHVIEIIADTPFDEFEDFYLELEKRAQKKMDDLVAPYLDNPAQIAQYIVYGNRTQEILDFIDNHIVDLIVMSSHKVDLEDLTRGWGTISYKVGVLAACPILLVK